MAARAEVRFGARVVAIDVADCSVTLADGSSIGYDALVSTLPLHETLALAGLTVDHPADPYTSVMVWNVGARAGPQVPRRPLGVPARFGVGRAPGRLLQQRRRVVPARLRRAARRPGGRLHRTRVRRRRAARAAARSTQIETPRSASCRPPVGSARSTWSNPRGSTSPTRGRRRARAGSTPHARRCCRAGCRDRRALRDVDVPGHRRLRARRPAHGRGALAAR